MGRSATARPSSPSLDLREVAVQGASKAAIVLSRGCVGNVLVDTLSANSDRILASTVVSDLGLSRGGYAVLTRNASGILEQSLSLCRYKHERVWRKQALKNRQQQKDDGGGGPKRVTCIH